MKKSFCLALIAMSFMLYSSVQAAVTTPVNCQKVIPTQVVENPDKYLNKDITFEAQFIGFSALGLGYKPAFRDREKYIGVLIKRDDSGIHNIPLSEMKIFIERKNTEKLSEIEVGDKIKITGKVFSTALGDPWVDAIDVQLLTKKEKKNPEKK